MKDSKSYSAQKHALHNLVQTIVNGEKGSIQAALDELGVGKNRQMKSELEAIQKAPLIIVKDYYASFSRLILWLRQALRMRQRNCQRL